MLPFSSARRSTTVSGFSLIEVALAIGVVAFAFVALLGMLPFGLSNLRKAMDVSIAAQIEQRVVSDVQETDFDTLLASKVETSPDGQFYLLATRYFDDQGNEVKVQSSESPTPQELAKVIYFAHVRGSMPGTSDPNAAANNFQALPTTGNKFNPRSSTVITVQVANNPGNKSIPRDAGTLLWLQPSEITSAQVRASLPAIQTFATVVARNGFNSPSSGS